MWLIHAITCQHIQQIHSCIYPIMTEVQIFCHCRNHALAFLAIHGEQLWITHCCGMDSFATLQLLLQWHQQYSVWFKDCSEVIATTVVSDSHCAAQRSYLRQHLEGWQFHSNEVMDMAVHKWPQRCDWLPHWIFNLCHDGTNVSLYLGNMLQKNDFYVEWASYISCSNFVCTCEPFLLIILPSYSVSSDSLVVNRLSPVPSVFV